MTTHRRPEVFDDRLVRDLPTPAQRWLRHCIAPGTPLHRTATLTMRGQIKLGSAWRPFTARQILSPPRGFVWAATARLFGLPISGFDRYLDGAGEMRWRLCGVIPVLSAGGPDVTRSAAGRLAGESVCLPTAFRSALWAYGPTPDTVAATWLIAGEAETVHLRIGPDGRLLGCTMSRWGNPDGTIHGRYPFGMTVEQERTFHGVTVPAVYRAGWWPGTSREDRGEFFRATVTDMSFA
jgi:hypothetical protein